MTDSVRNYIYIDEPSLNSYLSSLGNGVLEEITEESGSEQESEGGGAVGLPSIGLGLRGRHNRLNTENVSTTMRVLAPYRVQRLEDILENEEIFVFNGQGGHSPSREEMVDLTAEASAMSLFRLESAIEAFYDIFGGETWEALANIADKNSGQGMPDMSMEDVSMEYIDDIRTVITQFTGTEIPLRMDIGGYPFVVLLDREFMRTLPEEEFLEDKEYTVLGRIEKIVEPGEEWDPIAASRILDKYVPQEKTGKKLQDQMKGMGENMNIQMRKEDLRVKGPGSIVHPIAMYW